MSSFGLPMKTGVIISGISQIVLVSVSIVIAALLISHVAPQTSNVATNVSSSNDSNVTSIFDKEVSEKGNLTETLLFQLTIEEKKEPKKNDRVVRGGSLAHIIGAVYWTLTLPPLLLSLKFERTYLTAPNLAALCFVGIAQTTVQVIILIVSVISDAHFRKPFCYMAIAVLDLVIVLSIICLLAVISWQEKIRESRGDECPCRGRPITLQSNNNDINDQRVIELQPVEQFSHF